MEQFSTRNLIEAFETERSINVAVWKIDNLHTVGNGSQKCIVHLKDKSGICKLQTIGGKAIAWSKKKTGYIFVFENVNVNIFTDKQGKKNRTMQMIRSTVTDDTGESKVSEELALWLLESKCFD